ncbi:unnamed protein product [Alopecurus aequalis]
MSTSGKAPMCPESAKFRIAPLQDEEELKTLFDKNVVTNSEAKVPPTSRSFASRINNVVDVEDVGCEDKDDPLVTPVRAHGKKKRACPYSPTPATTPKMNVSSSSAARLDRMVEMMEIRRKERTRFMTMEEEKSKTYVTSPGKANESLRDEIRRLVAIIYQDGASPGSLEYFYATQLFLLREYREMFACLVEDATPTRGLIGLK